MLVGRSVLSLVAIWSRVHKITVAAGSQEGKGSIVISDVFHSVLLSCKKYVRRDRKSVV